MFFLTQIVICELKLIWLTVTNSHLCYKVFSHLQCFVVPCLTRYALSPSKLNTYAHAHFIILSFPEMIILFRRSFTGCYSYAHVYVYCYEHWIISCTPAQTTWRVRAWVISQNHIDLMNNHACIRTYTHEYHRGFITQLNTRVIVINR